MNSFAYDTKYRFEIYDTLGSTNSLALEKAKKGESGNLWILAKKQTKGRGRLGRNWQSCEGNLAASLLLIVPYSFFLYSPLFSFCAGILLVETLHCFKTKSRYIDCEGKERRRFQLKWPNDLLGEGKKIAGILVETMVLDQQKIAVVVGIGMNVASHPQNLPYPTTSLQSLNFGIYDIQTLFFSLMKQWVLVDKIWDNGRGLNKIKNLWLSYAIDQDQKIMVRVGHRMEKGFFCTINDKYECIIKLENGEYIVLSSSDLDYGNFFVL